MAYDGTIKIGVDLDEVGFKASLGKLGNIAKTGLTATVAAIGAISVGLTAGATAVFTYGKAYESAFAGVKKTVTGTAEEIAELDSGIRQMAKEMPTAATEIAGVAEAAGQLGIKTPSIEDFTKTMVMLGDTTNLSAQQAATELARLANITGMAQGDFDKLGSTIVALGNNFATTEAEISSMALRLAGAGKQVGLSEADILAFATALSSVGIEADAGGSAFSKVMIDMQLAVETGSESLEQFADAAGVSTGEFAKAFKEDAAGAMLMFIEGLGKAEERGMSAIAVLDDMNITEIRLRDSLLRASAASEIFSNAIDVGNGAWRENVALSKEAEQRYATVDSKLAVLKNTFIDLAISIYQSSDQGIAKTLGLFSDFGKRMTEAFNEGGMSQLAGTIGDIFADLALYISKAIPSIIRSAVDLITAFAQSIENNADKLANSGVKLVQALISGVLKTLPKLAQAASKLMSEFAKSLGKSLPLLKPFTSIVELLGKNLKTLTVVIAGAVGGMVAFKGALKVDIAVKALAATMATLNKMMAANALQLVAANGGLTLMQGAVALLTGKITLATAAQAAWNAVMAINPIVLITVAIGALVAGLAAYAIHLNSTVTESEKMMEATRLSTEKLEEQAQAYAELKAAQEEQALADIAQIDNAKRLYDELVSITDENGNVTEANEARAKFIIGELNDALNTELEMTNRQIKGYADLKSNIDDVVKARKAQILLEANEELYAQSVEKVAEAQDVLRESSYLLTEATEERMKADKELTASSLSGSLDRQKSALDELEAARKREAEAETEHNNAAAEYKKYTDNIVNYGNAMTAALEGDSEKVISILSGEQAAYKTAKDVTTKSVKEQKEILGQQYANILTNLNEHIILYGNSTEKYHKDEIDRLKKQAEDAKIEAEKVGNAIVDGTIIGIDGKSINLKSTIDSLFDLVPQWAKDILGIQSPSKVFADIGKQVTEGFAKGINDNTYIIDDALSVFDTETETEIITPNMLAEGQTAGTAFMEGFASMLDRVTLAARATVSGMTPQSVYDSMKGSTTTSNTSTVNVYVTAEGGINSQMDIDAVARQIGVRTQRELRSRGVVMA